tara:strand:+ start:98 stop:514 length:417 start_codon:yes stop_codon:yes gene_type:complete
MATEILVNDGGAPARILPFLAGEDISAGEALTSSATADMTAVLATQANINIIGFALTDAASGDMCSVITGKGVILNVQCLPTTGGYPQMIGAAASGQLAKQTAAEAAKGNGPVAVPVKVTNEAGSGLAVAGLWRCLII